MREVYKEIQIYLNDLLVDIGSTAPTRTELWQSAKYLRLRQIIEEKLTGSASAQIDIVQSVLEEVFKEVIGREMKDFKQTLPEAEVDAMIRRLCDTAWSGSNYSKRIWINAGAAAAHLEKDITDMIVLGKNPTQIKAKLAEDLGVSYHVADRLIRTESAYIMTQASIEGYKAAGIQQVKYLHKAEGNCKSCDCEALDGKIFDLGTEPTIPQHPNCRCCYAPVIKLPPLKENTDK